MADIFYVLRSAAANDVDSKRRVQLVETLVESINEKKHGKNKTTNNDLIIPTPVEYYFAAISMLSVISNEMESDVLYLLTKIIPQVPPSVLVKNSSDILQRIEASIMRSTSATGKRNGVEIFGCLLSVHPSSDWNQPAIAKSFAFVLEKMSDETPKVRKAAQLALMAILEKQVNSTNLRLTGEVLLRELDDPENKWLAFMGGEQGAAFAAFLNLYMDGKLGKKVLQKLLDLLHLSNQSFRIRQKKDNSLNRSLLPFLTSVAFSTREEATSMTEQIINSQTLRFNDLEIWCDLLHIVYVKDDSAYSGNGVGKLLVADAFITNYLHLQQQQQQQLDKSLMAALQGKINAIFSIPIQESDKVVFSKIGELLVKCFSNQYQHSWHVSAGFVHSFLTANAAVLRNKKTMILLTDTCCKIRESIIENDLGDEGGITYSPEWLRPVEKNIALCMRVLGVKTFLEIVPLVKSNVAGINLKKSYLIGLFKEAFKNVEEDGFNELQLGEFKSIFLALAKSCEDAAEDANGEGALGLSKLYKTRSLQLFGLFPAYCHASSVLSMKSALEELNSILIHALGDFENPSLGSSVCLGLSNLIKRNCVVANLYLTETEGHSVFANAEKYYASDEEEEEDDDDEAMEDDANASQSDLEDELNVQVRKKKIYSLEEIAKAKETLALLQQAAGSYFPLLFNSYDISFRAGLEDRCSHILECAGNFARILQGEESEQKDQLSTFFKRVLKKYSALKSNDLDTKIVLLSVLTSLSPYVHMESDCETLVGFTRPLLNEENGALVKKGYLILANLFSPYHATWVMEHRQELFELLINAKQDSSQRLHCVSRFVSTITPDREMCSELISDVVLSLKEKNSAVRKHAFAAFTSLARGMFESEGIADFFLLVTAGLHGQTPHARSATVVGVARLVSILGREEEISQSYEGLLEAVKACLELRHEKSREVLKSLISLIKVCAILMDVQRLTQLLSTFAQTLLPHADDSKNKFSLKIRVIFEKLMKRLGLEAIEKVLPRHHRLFVYLEKKLLAGKQKKIERRENAIEEEEEQDVDVKSRKSKPMTNKKSITEKSVKTSKTMNSARTRGTTGKKASAMTSSSSTQLISQDSNLLESAGLSNKLSSLGKRSREEEDEVEFKTDSAGRLVVPDLENDSKSGRKRARVDDVSEDDEAAETDKASFAKLPPQRKKQKKKREQQFGKEFKSAKSGGDVKRKGVDPYSYIPLDHRLLSKKKKRAAVNQYAGIGKSKARRGYLPRGRKED